jgi:hypothetical protein
MKPFSRSALPTIRQARHLSHHLGCVVAVWLAGDRYIIGPARGVAGKLIFIAS